MAMEILEAGEIEAVINELETKISRLRAIYEQYFMGIERMPPSTLRKDVVRLIHRLENVHIRNTATKFRVRSLIQRFNSYKAYWTRIERQIEEGTYIRDIRRAERNRERRRARSDDREGADARPDSGAGDDGVIEIDFEQVMDLRELEVELVALDNDGAFDRKPSQPHMTPRSAPLPTSGMSSDEIKRRKLAEIAGALGIGGDAPSSTAPTTPASTVAPRGAPASVGARRDKLADIKARLEQRSADKPVPPSVPAASSGGGGGDDARRVFDQLLAAKRQCNEPTENISYDSVAKSIQKQRQQIEQSRGKDVEFKVVIKEGRAFIKPETK